MSYHIWSGIYIQIILGPSQTSETTRVLQYLGIAASLISICKGTSDWWARTKAGDWEEEPAFVETLKAALFFTPHLIFQAVAMSMSAAFLGYYVLCPATIIFIIVLCNFLSLYKEAKKDSDDVLELTISLILTLFSYSHTACKLMKRTITTFTTILITTLTIIRFLPLIISPDTLVATYGLRHLNFLPPSAGVFN